MTILIHSLFICIFIFACFVGFLSYKNKSYVSLFVSASLASKIILFFILESGLKYIFVLDSLKYEIDAWNIMKARVSDTPYVLEAFQRYEYLNPFTRIVIEIFSLFGNFPQIPSLMNIFVTLALYYFCIKIFDSLISTQNSDANPKQSLGLCVLLFLYPSLNVWSVTNTKDPWILALFFAVLYLIGRLIKKWSQLTKFKIAGHTVLILTLIYFGQLFRPYNANLTVAGFFLGFFINYLRKKLSYTHILVLLVAILFSGFFLFEITDPVGFSEMNKNIFAIRKAFLNEGAADDYAKSAFLVNFTFERTVDYLLFIPQALAFYFFGPFFWDIRSMSEGFGLIEVAMIVFLIKPFFKGFNRICRVNPVQTHLLLGIFLVFSISQAMFVANLGTVFRLRALTVLIYLIIAAAGLTNDKKENKNTKNFL